MIVPGFRFAPSGLHDGDERRRRHSTSRRSAVPIGGMVCVIHNGRLDQHGINPMGAPFRLRQIDHIVLRVRDVAAMRRFYCDVLGCTFEREQAEIGLLQLRAGASLIDLVDVGGKLGRKGGAAPGAEGRNVDHFCLRIEGWDEEGIVAHLRAHGVAIGEIARRYGAEGEGPSVYIEDPEGNTVELKGPPDLP